MVAKIPVIKLLVIFEYIPPCKKTNLTALGGECKVATLRLGISCSIMVIAMRFIVQQLNSLYTTFRDV